jgi:hypothetical protein
MFHYIDSVQPSLFRAQSIQIDEESNALKGHGFIRAACSAVFSAILTAEGWFQTLSAFWMDSVQPSPLLI